MLTAAALVAARSLVVAQPQAPAAPAPVDEHANEVPVPKTPPVGTA